jgi:hypothetical protein
MPVPHSSTPWSISKGCPTHVIDKNSLLIVSVIGSNEQSEATAAHIVRVVNEWHENHADAENERHAAAR